MGLLGRGVVVTAALLALLTGCDDKDGASPGREVDVVGSWVPEPSFVDDRSPVFDVRDAVIRFDTDGEWTADDGCNRYDGYYTLRGDQWTAGTHGFVGGVGCPWGSVQYALHLGGEAVSVRRDGSRLVFLDADGDVVLRLRTYDGDPPPFRQVDGRDLVGDWRPVVVFGRRVHYDGPYGQLSVREQGLGVLEGCRFLHGTLELGTGGGFIRHLRTEPTGCPAWTADEDLGPDTFAVLRRAVRVQVHASRLSFYAPGHRLIGVFRRDDPA